MKTIIPGSLALFALAKLLFLLTLSHLSAQVVGGGDPLNHLGVDYVGKGGATLDAEGERLVISNIGSSGEDGVCMFVGTVSIFHCVECTINCT